MLLLLHEQSKFCHGKTKFFEVGAINHHAIIHLPHPVIKGDRLRTWMGIDSDTFYDEQKIAIIPMGFCYPGTGKSGDLPPRPECAKLWRAKLLAMLPNIQLTLVIGQYAIAYHLPNNPHKNLTETVRHWRDHWQENGPCLIPLPHPSPRNNIWLKKNPWFEGEVIPRLQTHAKSIL